MQVLLQSQRVTEFLQPSRMFDTGGRGAPYLVKHGGYDLREDLVTLEINTERLPSKQRRSFEKNRKRGRENFDIPIFSS